MKPLKNLMSGFVVVMMMTFLFGCQTDSSKQQETILDPEGNQFEIPSSVERILSTAPSNTEILIGLGLADSLVGVDVYSTDIEGLPSHVEVIDFANPNPEAIIAMEPDVIIASETNKIGDDDPYALLKEAGIAVVYIPSSESIEDIYEDIEFIADMTNQEANGQVMINEMKQEVNEIKEIAQQIIDPKTVYFEIGSMPNLYSVGNLTFINQLIETIGAQNIFADQTGWIAVSEEAVINKNPDVILTNESYLENPVKSIKERSGFESIKAIENDKVYLIDKNASSRSSQHVIKALKEMAQAIYPEYYEN